MHREKFESKTDRQVYFKVEYASCDFFFRGSKRVQSVIRMIFSLPSFPAYAYTDALVHQRNLRITNYRLISYIDCDILISRRNIPEHNQTFNIDLLHAYIIQRNNYVLLFRNELANKSDLLRVVGILRFWDGIMEMNAIPRRRQ